MSRATIFRCGEETGQEASHGSSASVFDGEVEFLSTFTDRDHAEFTNSERNDNIESMAHQGHGGSGRGNGAVVYTLAPNPDAQSRSGMLIIAGQTFTVMQAGSSGADLTGSWVTLTQACVNSGARMRCTLVGSLQITNRGTVTPRLFRVRYFLSTDPILSADDQLLRRRLAVVRLTPGKAVTKVFRNRLPLGQSASGMYVIADLDATHLVVETNESNNTLVFGPLP